MTGARKLLAAGAATLGGIAIVIAWSRLPATLWLLAVVEWAREAGVAGAVVYGAVYVCGTVLMLPGSLLTLGAGFLYGPIWGTVVVMPASVAGATIAFALGRSIARGWVERRVGRSPRFAAVDEAVGRRGFRIVLLLRLSPVFPFNILNYALALTRVTLPDYVLASLVGMFPGALLYVYLGSLVTTTSELGASARPPAGNLTSVMYWAGLLATIAATVVITRIAREALARALGERGASDIRA